MVREDGLIRFRVGVVLARARFRLGILIQRVLCFDLDGHKDEACQQLGQVRDHGRRRDKMVSELEWIGVANRTMIALSCTILLCLSKAERELLI